MDDIQIKSDLIKQLIEISKEAGNAILEIYNSDFDYTFKDDSTPLTKADQQAHEIITKKLYKLTPHIPILSEEDSDISFDIRTKWGKYWLIDPLDGTKEFIKRNGEFTVNIALVENNSPRLGIIHLPVTSETYWGSKSNGSFYINSDNQSKKISVSKKSKNIISIMASRSHPNEKLDSLLERIESYEVINRGSSLKFCQIASGQADIYPRFGPTSEWDIAAGHAILLGAHGNIYDLNGKEIKYNIKSSYLNPFFIASSSKELYFKLIKYLQ